MLRLLSSSSMRICYNFPLLNNIPGILQKNAKCAPILPKHRAHFFVFSGCKDQDCRGGKPNVLIGIDIYIYIYVYIYIYIYIYICKD